MPRDHDHVNGSVNLDDAESVMREVVSPIPVGLRLAGLTANPGAGLSLALVRYHPAGQARGAT